MSSNLDRKNRAIIQGSERWFGMAGDAKILINSDGVKPHRAIRAFIHILEHKRMEVAQALKVFRCSVLLAADGWHDCHLPSGAVMTDGLMAGKVFGDRARRR